MAAFLLSTFPLLHAHRAGDHVAIVTTLLRMAQRLGAGCRVLVARLQDVHLAFGNVPVKQL